MRKRLEARIRKKLFWALLPCGLFLAGALILWGFFQNENTLWLIVAVGAVSLFQLLVYFHEKHEAEKHPDYVRKQYAEESDERNIMIRDRSAYHVYNVANFIFYATAFLFFFLENFRLFYLFWGIAVAQQLIFYVLKRYNSRKL